VFAILIKKNGEAKWTCITHLFHLHIFLKIFAIKCPPNTICIQNLKNKNINL